MQKKMVFNCVLPWSTGTTSECSWTSLTQCQGLTIYLHALLIILHSVSCRTGSRYWRYGRTRHLVDEHETKNLKSLTWFYFCAKYEASNKSGILTRNRNFWSNPVLFHPGNYFLKVWELWAENIYDQPNTPFSTASSYCLFFVFEIGDWVFW